MWLPGVQSCRRCSGWLLKSLVLLLGVWGVARVLLWQSVLAHFYVSLGCSGRFQGCFCAVARGFKVVSRALICICYVFVVVACALLLKLLSGC